ncbi:hypothetical protein DEO23_03485 [Brachybacterium endophyticum]|uniref:Uncharacterized protein n=1 Tax=Brachybacterium endophyticum TaxID=2182385 RepID=A0A2U2RPA2_9MICO|nr:hypothetical protein [Brachybacterium endophyticum]PWH07697.1 hypothetical protein DEO23_03485 [Brachybacterium endophyticum]
MSAPAPRRTRRHGRQVVGPTLRARYLPGALIGVPLLALLLGTFPAAGIEQWRAVRLRAGHDGPLLRVLEPGLVQFLLGALLVWALVALWALVPLLITHRTVHLDPDVATLHRIRRLRIVESRPLHEVVRVEADAERGGIGVITFADGAEWVVPESGWDTASFDGFRALQVLAQLPVQPPRGEVIAAHRRAHRIGRDRESAERIGMPWQRAYDDDPSAFLAEFDRRRRVLGGKEPPRPGDLVREGRARGRGRDA